MLAKYGTYTLPSGSFEMSRTSTANYSDAGQPYSETVRVQVDGRLMPSTPTPAAMDVLVKALNNAFSLNGKDFIVYLPSNSTSSQSASSTSSLGGSGAISASSASQPFRATGTGSSSTTPGALTGGAVKVSHPASLSSIVGKSVIPPASTPLKTQNKASSTAPAGASQLSLLNLNSIDGVKIIQRPSFPTLQNAAYVTWLPFTFVLEAEYPVNDAASILLEFEETVTFEGGGPVFGWWKPLVGFPVRQQVRMADTYRATQAGRAVGYLGRPPAAAPLWLGALNRFPGYSIRSPRRRGNSFINYETTWQYEFESAVPLQGNPSAWL